MLTIYLYYNQLFHFMSDKGLESAMRFFGLTAGHTNDGNDEAGLTCMISNLCIPDTYEPGRFHLFGIGAYICISLSNSRSH